MLCSVTITSNVRRPPPAHTSSVVRPAARPLMTISLLPTGSTPAILPSPTATRVRRGVATTTDWPVRSVTGDRLGGRAERRDGGHGGYGGDEGGTKSVFNVISNGAAWREARRVGRALNRVCQTAPLPVRCRTVDAPSILPKRGFQTGPALCTMRQRCVSAARSSIAFVAAAATLFAPLGTFGAEAPVPAAISVTRPAPSARKR